MNNPFQDQLADLQSKIDEATKLQQDPQFKEMADAELQNLEQQQQMLQQAAEQIAAGSSSSADPAETGKKGACTIEIRGGAGGDEAKIWANDLLRMYLRFIESKKLKVEFIDDLIIKVTGHATFDLSADNDSSESAAEGKNAVNLSPFEIFQNESGVHRVQRVPTTEAQGRIHTSTASVAVLPEVPVEAVDIRDEDLDWQFMRASGAGGQSVNKTSSAVRLIHKPTGITVTSRQEKKQEQNRKIALDLLRSQLWEIEEEKRLQELGEARSAIGRARRAEKIRTYNYPQNRVTDHRTKQSWYNLPNIVDGQIETMIVELKNELDQQQASSAESSDEDSTATE